ncbi:unnamed protein product, partial [Cylicostephanus goldi]
MAGQRITHGASRNPVAIIKIEAIETLKLPKDKVVISFFDLKPTHVGFNGTTVAAATLNWRPVITFQIEAIGAMSPEDNIRHTQK